MAISASAGLLSVTIGLAALAALTPTTALAQAPSPHPRAASPAARSGALAGAVMPGFETLADGSSRLFVELSKAVAYDTKAARGSVTYVLKDARVLRRNNTNPLVTVHFNTPVTTARLVPHGRDLWFVVALRADVQPTVSMNAGKDGSALMRIELPKGAYLPAPAAPAVPSQDPSTAAGQGSPEATSAPASENASTR
jgi:hypothetical protein